MGIIKQEYKNEYENRVKEICGAFITAYYDCFYLTGIEERKNSYVKERSNSNFYRCAIEFFYSIVNALQKEEILILCVLEDPKPAANSLRNLKSALRSHYVEDFNVIKNYVKKLPSKNKPQCIGDARNKVIAHIELKKELAEVPMIEVKQRLDMLRRCYNSYLFDGAVKYLISNDKVKDIQEESRLGVNLLFSGQMDEYYTGSSMVTKKFVGENNGE